MHRILFIYGLVVQLVRTLACHARGPGFESPSGRQFASVAQLVEQGTENPRVVGSIPTGGTIYADLAHLVERDLAKVEVAGSSPRKPHHAKMPPFWVTSAWWAFRDSNPGPTGYEPVALTN